MYVHAASHNKSKAAFPRTDAAFGREVAKNTRVIHTGMPFVCTVSVSLQVDLCRHTEYIQAKHCTNTHKPLMSLQRARGHQASGLVDVREEVVFSLRYKCDLKAA